MSTRITFDRQEAGVWTPQVGLSVAANIPESYEAVRTVAGVRFYCGGRLAYNGVCFKQVNPIDPRLAVAPFTVTTQWTMLTDDSPCVEALEMDKMYADPHGNVGNCSTHLNIQKGGVFEIVAPSGAWLPTAYVPGIPPAGEPTPCMVQALIDPVKATTQIVAASVGALPPFAINGPVLPFLTGLLWAPNELVDQAQPGLGVGGGAMSFEIRAMSTTVVWA